jgi:3-hydroxybutyryl-CoA dehydrogenase
LHLVDLIRADTVAATASRYASFKEPMFAPPPHLLRMVQVGFCLVS